MDPPSCDAMRYCNALRSDGGLPGALGDIIGGTYLPKSKCRRHEVRLQIGSNDFQEKKRTLGHPIASMLAWLEENIISGGR